MAFYENSFILIVIKYSFFFCYHLLLPYPPNITIYAIGGRNIFKVLSSSSYFLDEETNCETLNNFFNVK